MAALTFQAVANKDNNHTVTKSTADAIGSAEAALIVDNTKTKAEVLQAARAAMRALSREFGGVTSPSSVPTSGATTE